MSKIPKLRNLDKSKIELEQETLEQIEEEIFVDNITPEELIKLFEYKNRIDEIVSKMTHAETMEFLDKIDAYAKSLVDNEELRDVELMEVLLFRFISTDDLEDEDEIAINDYDLPDELSIEKFLQEILSSY